MGYCTEVVFTLLSAHIQQMVQQKSNVGLLFRRSDSLVEKLFQHWLSICLFPALMDAAGPGRQLFLLYKALKYQCEKGPIDSCTGNARYSLSEQKLLRESVDSTPVTLMILPVAGFDQAPIPLKVLDCDTILQVKMKLLDLLYRNTAFSKRMTVDQFDLGKFFEIIRILKIQTCRICSIHLFRMALSETWKHSFARWRPATKQRSQEVAHYCILWASEQLCFDYATKRSSFIHIP